MKLIAYAKINIYLKVISLENNYHNLKMINAKVNLYDIIKIKENKTDELIFKNNPLLHPKKDDLIIKIIKYLKEKYQIKKSYQIEITKNIPIQAGLGGGSSDIAEIVKFIIKDNNIKIDKQTLIQEMIKFGSDIPYCLYNDICLVEEKGDKITKLNLKDIYKNKDILIINPNILIKTKDVFKKFDEINNYTKEEKIELFKTNDLEQAAFTLNPKMKEVKTYLNAIIKENLIMSGSGSTYIALVEKNNSEKLKEKIQKETNWFVSINQIIEV